MQARYCRLVFLIWLAVEARASREASESGQLDRSGWRKVEAIKSGHKSTQRQLEDRFRVPTSKVSTAVEWDDDEFNDAAKFHRASEESISRVSQSQSDLHKSEHQQQVKTRPKWTELSSKYNKLVFHGPLKLNETSKLVDGVRFKINIHNPVGIIRGSPMRENSKSIREQDDFERADSRVDPPARAKVSFSKFWDDTVPEEDRANSLSGSSSDWRPIVLSTAATMVSVDKKLAALKNSTNLIKSKWKPVKLAESRTSSTYSKENVGKYKTIWVDSSPSINMSSTTSSIGEPFEEVTDRSDELDTNNGLHSQTGQRESKSFGSQKAARSGWTPVELVTMSPQEVVPVTTVRSAIPFASNKSSSQTNSSESAQRSASDLNYIYSQAMPTASRELDGWQSVARQQNSYYSNSNYAVGQSVNQPQPQQTLIDAPAVVDTTSGQTPEMIASDRQQDPSSIPIFTMDYSSPPRQVSFQSAYDTQAYMPPTRAQPIRAAPSQSPIVRQEHHYHYYNQNPQRQQTIQPDPPERSIIREIQPVLISQPQSTTSAPQIIREIIKEVPVTQTVQLPRIILPPPPPVAIPLSPASRELEPIYTSYPGPAQRIIRHISNNVPTVSFRMPAAATVLPVVPQIRLPVPPIPIPVARLAPAPVTRQTGSFLIPPMPKKTTTYYTETQAMPTHTTIMHTTQYTPATRTTVYTTDHQPPQPLAAATATGVAYRSRR